MNLTQSYTKITLKKQAQQCPLRTGIFLGARFYLQRRVCTPNRRIDVVRRMYSRFSADYLLTVDPRAGSTDSTVRFCILCHRGKSETAGEVTYTKVMSSGAGSQTLDGRRQGAAVGLD